MAVNSSYTPKITAGNGITTSFPTAFELQKTSEVVVYELDADDVKYPKTEGSDYSVVLVGSAPTYSSCTVNMNVAPAIGRRLVRERVLPFTQISDYVLSDPAPADTVEGDFDRAIMINQQLYDESRRAIKLPAYSVLRDVEIEDLVAGSTLIINAAANGVEMGPTADEIENAQTYANNAAASASAAQTAETNAETAETNAEAAATAAAAALVAAGLPGSLTGKTLNMLRVKADESGYEHRTPTQVRGDVSAAASGANSDITSLAAITSINNGQLGGFRNRIINGAFNVSQRVIGTADNSYTLDRWRLLLEAANAATVTRNSASTPTGFKHNLKLTVGSGNNNKFGVWQVIEGQNIYDLRGQTVTLSAKIKATAGLSNIKMAIVEFTGTEDSVSGDPISAWGANGVNPTLAANYAFGNTPANLNVTTSFADYSVNHTVGASATNLAVFIWNDDKTTTTTTDQLDIGAVQLEKGSVATQFEQRGRAIEEKLCEWYFKKIGNSAATCYFATGVNYNNATDGLCMLHYERGRTTPTASVSAAGDFEVFQVNPGTTKTLTTFSISGLNSNAALLAVGGWTAGTANSGIMLRSLNTSAAIYLDMEL